MTRWILLLVLLAAGILLWRLLADSPVSVETAAARRGPIRSSVEEEGKTRVPDRYLLSAPVAGRLFRIAKREGDAVARGEIVAEIDPLPLRSRIDEAEARIGSLRQSVAGVDRKKPKPEELERARTLETRAREARLMAERELAESKALHEQARRDSARERELLRTGAGSAEGEERAAMEEARTAERMRVLEAQLRLREVEIRAAEIETAIVIARQGDFDWEAASLGEEIRAIEASLAAVKDDLGRTRVAAPVDGLVLQRFLESETVVASGTPLLEIGSLAALEVEADFLSEDAALMRPGMAAEISGRALAGRALRARVLRIYPYAFTKISSLGVEQQRTTVVCDFPLAEAGVGDRFRVDVRVVLEERADAILVPEEALFRHDGRWHVFVVEGARARLRAVEPGLADGLAREVRSGLAAGERVVLHPGGAVADGTKVEAREAEAGGTP